MENQTAAYYSFVFLLSMVKINSYIVNVTTGKHEDYLLRDHRGVGIDIL